MFFPIVGNRFVKIYVLIFRGILLLFSYLEWFSIINSLEFMIDFLNFLFLFFFLFILNFRLILIFLLVIFLLFYFFFS